MKALLFLAFHPTTRFRPITAIIDSSTIFFNTSTSRGMASGAASRAGGDAKSPEAPALVVDPFCYRQFSETDGSKDYGGTVFDIAIEEFTAVANRRYDERTLVDGYAPFCKHLFIENDFTDAKVNVLPITTENESLLRCRYEARNEKELPVLTRYFPKELVTSPDKPPLPTAKYLDLILYSREQINKENEAMGNDSKSESPWGIVSIKAQDVDYELPMQPITAMRNALGKSEGGSGIPIDRDSYMVAYNYWKDHAVVA